MCESQLVDEYNDWLFRDAANFVELSRPFWTGPAGSVVEHPLRDREVVGSIPGRAIPKALKMVPVATLLGAQHYEASTGFSSPNKISHN